MAHGVTVSEVPTTAKPPVRVTPGLAVAFGTAPVNLGDVAAVNKPILCETLADFEASFGPLQPSSRWAAWTLHEVAAAYFELYQVGPLVVVNVADPTNAEHYDTHADVAHVLDSDGNASITVYGDPAPAFGVLKASVVVNVGGVTKTLGTDYTLAFDEDGYLVVSRVTSGTIAGGAHLAISWHQLDGGAVAVADVIGGYSAGAYKGIAVADQVYPRLRLVPGFLLAPGYSSDDTVAAALASKAHALNGGAFRAVALLDLPTDGTIATYADAPAYKVDHGFGAIDAIALWPRVKHGADLYHLSTHAAAIANVTDADHNGIPYASPSNKALVAEAAVLDDGTEIHLDGAQAQTLNVQGIVTALNGFNGWRLWGNRTAIYPSDTDPRNAFIPIRRMFSWIAASVILTTDRDVDEPGNKRLIESVVGTVGIWLNSLIAQGALVDGRIEFRKGDNNTSDLSDGIYRFHVTLTPPSPAEALDFLLEYDPSALAALFT